MQKTSFPTAVIGSLPRPRWLLDQLIAHEEGRLAEQELDALLDRSIPFAVALQESAGIDTISDGEWRRIGYFEVFARRVGGFTRGPFETEEPTAEIKAAAEQSAPQQWTLTDFQQTLVTAPLRYEQPIAAEGARFLRQQTDRQIKVALPAPHMICGRLWHPVHSRAAYPTRRAFIDAVLPILRAELIALRDVGVDIVQFDDPWFGFFVDAHYRARFADPVSAMHEAIDDLNAVVAGISGIRTALHVCRGNRDRTVYARGDYEPILPALLRAEVDQLALEFAITEAGDLDVFAGHTLRQELALGVVDVRSREIESPAVIVARGENALRHFAPQQLTLTPDCGFAPTSTNPISLDEAYLKLRNLSEAAAILRAKYG
ncbi:MAG: cobalamin-independent methionine synthase II family protein [Chloroflexi bacterium]|nr:cobalamin-independent methionine synthase II family protein [Chloroflexota bacterium]